MHFPLVLWAYPFPFNRTPTCSPSSSLTFNLPPPRTSALSLPCHHCVRLLVIIIAAVNHPRCQALLGSKLFLQIQIHLKSPAFLFPLVPHLSSPLAFHPTLRSSQWVFVHPCSLLSQPVWAARCVRVQGYGGFFRITGPPLCLCSDARSHKEGGSVSVCEN